MPWAESILVMQVLDEVRKSNGLEYPLEMERVDYTPEDS